MIKLPGPLRSGEGVKPPTQFRRVHVCTKEQVVSRASFQRARHVLNEESKEDVDMEKNCNDHDALGIEPTNISSFLRAYLDVMKERSPLLCDYCPECCPDDDKQRANSLLQHFLLYSPLQP